MRWTFLQVLLWATTLPRAFSLAVPFGSASGHAIPAAAPEFAITEHEMIQARISAGGKNGKKFDPPGKYFHESTFHPHYDGRFAVQELPYDDRRSALVALIRSYLSAMNEIGASTWIMHGSLLGWWWNKKVMPWDTDLDVMVSEQSMDHLANYYNMTVHHFKDQDLGKGHDYMLEINPHYRNTSHNDKLNKIDARWVDMSTGLFIDITTLHRDIEAEESGMTGVMMSKDDHHYKMDDIFPLRGTVFEGVTCFVPFGYSELLIEEYGAASLTNRDFEKHHFDQLSMEWIPVSNSDVKPERSHELSPQSPSAEQDFKGTSPTASPITLHT